MRFQSKFITSVTAFLLLTSMVFLTGCQSGLFHNPDLPKIKFPSIKKPDMSGLAFWKKDDNNVPPPPALRFNPSLGGEKMASSGDSDIQQEFNKMAVEARRLQASADTSDPIRTPYVLPELGNNPSSTDNNSFAGSGRKPSMNSSSSLDQAQQDFRSAIANTRQAANNSWQNGTQSVQNMASDVQKSASGELVKMQSQVSLAQQQIAELKRQVAAAKQQGQTTFSNAASNITQSANDFTSATSAAIQKPVDHVARLNIPPFRPTTSGNFSPMGSNPATQNSLTPNNTLRSRSTTPGSSPLSPQPLRPQSSNAYPATPHSSYSPKSSSNDFGMLSPKSDLAKSSSSAPANSQVIQASSTPSPASNIAPASHTTDVEIPAAILQGSSSYAPGSVSPLKPSR